MSLRELRSQAALNGPSALNSVMQGSGINTESFSPFCDTQRHPLMRQVDVARRVSHLLMSGRPTTVAGFVIALIVSAIKRVFLGWARTHVVNKVFKLMPSIADRNTFGSVALKPGTARTLAAIDHRAPDGIFSRGIQAVSRPHVELKAATALRMESGQVRPQHISGLSADTLAPPSRSPLGNLRQCSESSKGQTSQVFGVLAVDAAAAFDSTLHQVVGADGFDRSARALAEPCRILFAPLVTKNCQSSEGEAGQIEGVMRKIIRRYAEVSHAVSSSVGAVVVRGWRSLVTAVSLAFNYPTRIAVGLVILALLTALTAPLSAAGTVVLTRADLGGGLTKYTLAWTSTAGGAVSANPVSLVGGATTKQQLVQVRIVPGTAGTQPTDLYDVTLVDAAGIDLLNGTGANNSNALGEYFIGDPPVVIGGATLDLVVANAGSAKTGVVEIWVEQP